MKFEFCAKHQQVRVTVRQKKGVPALKSSTISNTVKSRSSGIEILRLLSLFGIILCHALSDGKSLTGINKYFCLLSNSAIHAGVGVVCFMLITGYFGANFSLKRFNKTYSVIYICSIVCLGCVIIAYGFSPMTALRSLIPVTSKRWWYASCYIFTLFLSPFLDSLAEKIDKKTFQKLLLLLLTLFYVIPTFLYFDIIGDKGKGLANMIIIYLLGRYLRKYPLKISTKALWIIMLSLMAVSFAGNCAVTILTKNIHWPFGRDCTITTLGISLSLFLICVRGEFVSKTVNFVARNAFYIYLLDFHMPYLKEQLNLSGYENSILFIPIILGFVLLTMAISFAASLILQYPAKLFEIILGRLEKSAIKLADKIFPAINPKLVKLKRLLEGENSKCQKNLTEQ